MLNVVSITGRKMKKMFVSYFDIVHCQLQQVHLHVDRLQCSVIVSRDLVKVVVHVAEAVRNAVLH